MCTLDNTNPYLKRFSAALSWLYLVMNIWFYNSIPEKFHIAYLILKKYGQVKMSRWNRQSVQNQVNHEFSCRIMAISWPRRRCELVAAGTVCKDRKMCFKIYQSRVVWNDNVTMFSPLEIITIFRLNRPTRRDVCAISAHNEVCCLSSPVYRGTPDRQNQVC